MRIAADNSSHARRPIAGAVGYGLSPLPGSRSKHCRGTGIRAAFTLLELLMAMAMAAMVIGALYAAVRIGFRAEAAAEAAVEPARTAELAMGLLRPDFESVVAPPATTSTTTGTGTGTTGATGTAGATAASTSMATGFLGTDLTGQGGLPADTVEFFTLGDPLESFGTPLGSTTPGMTGIGGANSNYNRGASSGAMSGGVLGASGNTANFIPGVGEMRMIDLLLVPSPSGNVLIRRITTSLLNGTTTTMGSGTTSMVAGTDPANGSYDEVVCRGVRSFNVRYCDGSGWLDSWDSTQQDNNCPTAVEVTIELQRGTGDQMRVLRYVRVFLLSTSGLWATSAANGGTGQ